MKDLLKSRMTLVILKFVLLTSLSLLSTRLFAEYYISYGEPGSYVYGCRHHHHWHHHFWHRHVYYHHPVYHYHVGLYHVWYPAPPPVCPCDTCSQCTPAISTCGNCGGYIPGQWQSRDYFFGPPGGDASTYTYSYPYYYDNEGYRYDPDLATGDDDQVRHPDMDINE